MKTPHSTVHHYSPAAIQAANRIPAGCINEESHKLGMQRGEPLLLILDSLLRYAKAHQGRYDSPLAEDYVLGVAWLDTIKGAHALLDGDGAVAMEIDRSTDSKDNGAMESLYAAALEAAGFDRNALGI